MKAGTIVKSVVDIPLSDRTGVLKSGAYGLIIRVYAPLSAFQIYFFELGSRLVIDAKDFEACNTDINEMRYVLDAADQKISVGDVVDSVYDINLNDLVCIGIYGNDSIADRPAEGFGAVFIKRLLSDPYSDTVLHIKPRSVRKRSPKQEFPDISQYKFMGVDHGTQVVPHVIVDRPDAHNLKESVSKLLGYYTFDPNASMEDIAAMSDEEKNERFRNAFYPSPEQEARLNRYLKGRGFTPRPLYASLTDRMNQMRQMMQGKGVLGQLKPLGTDVVEDVTLLEEGTVIQANTGEKIIHTVNVQASAEYDWIKQTYTKGSKVWIVYSYTEGEAGPVECEITEEKDDNGLYTLAVVSLYVTDTAVFHILATEEQIHRTREQAQEVADAANKEWEDNSTGP